jgi:hypothetical protein
MVTAEGPAKTPGNAKGEEEGPNQLCVVWISDWNFMNAGVLLVVLSNGNTSTTEYTDASTRVQADASLNSALAFRQTQKALLSQGFSQCRRQDLNLHC